MMPRTFKGAFPLGVFILIVSQSLIVCGEEDQSDVGKPGLFQELPLNCFHCANDHECNQNSGSLGVLRKCEGDKYQTCSTAFARNGSVVARGCSALLQTQCSKADVTCQQCKSTGCNSAVKLDDYVDCLFCESRTDENCNANVKEVTRTRKCHGHCMTIAYPRTTEEGSPLEMIRTCLDDMDRDDREDCLDGKNESCRPCAEANCNADKVFDTFSCYHCKGDDCPEAQPKNCSSFLKNDQCFIEYDEDHNLVSMGCKSDYDPQELVLRIKQKRLLLCEGENCNGFENIPEDQICTLCNSRTDSKCALSPEKVKIMTKCSHTPVNQCYTRILESGHTERGCAKDLNGDDYYNCLLGAGECNICFGDKCNQKMYPENRLSCHTCSSETSGFCEKNPAASKLCPLHHQNQTCVMKLDREGHTVRGCGLSLPCSDDDQVCATCASGNCNTDYIKRKADGKPGMWQELPLKCLVCSDENSCQSADNSFIKCSQDNDYCMTVFNEKGEVVRRGCSSDVENTFKSYCDANSEHCFNCNSNECNRAISLDNYIDCVYCDSRLHKGCLANPEAVANSRKCLTACMTVLKSRNGTDSTYDLIRTCLDDKDTKDQLECSGNDCRSCEGPRCNTEVLPEDRLSCLSCEDCATAESQLCNVYKPNDKCYQLYDDENEIKQLGCLSDLTEEFIDKNVLNLYICEGKDCNDFDKRPNPINCVVCHSEDDENCATQPVKVGQDMLCSRLPHVHCFTQILEDGSTERGCVSDLAKNSITSCLSGNSSTCTVCQSDRCNVEIFPKDRQLCQRCNSNEDPFCSRNPSSAKACPRFKENDGCSVKLVNGVIYRGCSSEFICDDTDKQYCRNCKGHNCNIADLEHGLIGYPDRWETTPLKCLSCEGLDCLAGHVETELCDSNLLQNCVTVFAKNDSVTFRGCSDTMYAKEELSFYCDSNPDFCQFCKSHQCNAAESLKDYVDCLKCDSNEQAECVVKPEAIESSRKCFKGCFTGFYPRNEETEENPAFELERGCWDDLSLERREKCNLENSPKCENCFGNGCNQNDLIEKRLKCYYCDDIFCEKVQEQTCTAYREDDQCYILYDGNEIGNMGCMSDLENSKIQADFRKIWKCSGDLCNMKETNPKQITCASCNSTEDKTCVISPQNIGHTTTCSQMPYTKCFSKVFPDGSTVRDCLEVLDDESFKACIDGDPSCLVCDNQSNCNKEIFPKDRRQCYICDSETDEKCEASPEHSEICLVYSANEECVTKLEGDRTVRGCSSQISCDSSDRSKCLKCSGDNCNTKNLLENSIGEPGKWQTLPLNCYKCKGSDCLTGSLPGYSKCLNNSLQTCMTVFNSAGQVIQRDCSDVIYDEENADYCEENPDKCPACKSNACNKAQSLNDYIDCYFCDSHLNPKCSIDFVASSSKTRKCHKACMVALYPRSSSSDPVYELSRTCLDDMDSDDQQLCSSGKNELCSSCEGSLCNTEDLPKERFKCYTCVEGDCENTELRSCPSYHPEDQCYTLFEKKENELIALGCRSDLEMEQIQELIKDKVLTLCSEEGCNNPETPPEPKRCKLCSSDNDPYCATNPNLISTTTRCTALPYSDCYTRVNSRGVTERGCLADLPNEDFYQCVIGNDTLCEVCRDNDCNSLDVFPADRLACQQCSSATDPNCESQPASIRVCPIYDANDYCMTNLRNGITSRGCGSSMKCDSPGDRKTCSICHSAGCNVVDLTLVGIEGEPGIWQKVPITCKTCQGENCTKGVTEDVECEGDPYQSCMTVFSSEGQVVQRGCSDIVEKENEKFCSSNRNNCLRCNSNLCNDASSLEDYIDCWTCDSKLNPKCSSSVEAVKNLRKCKGHCMTAMYPRENETEPALVLTRTCLDDMDSEDQELCLNGTMEHCAACNTKKCNSLKMPEKRLSCLHCPEGNCDEAEAQECPFYRENDQCYIRFDEDNQVVGMGCRSEYSNEEATLLLMKKRLVLCTGDDCNSLDSLPQDQRCALCNSRSDESCATNPNAIVSSTLCSRAPYTQCYSRILSDGSTERGCLSSLQDQDFLNCLDPLSKNCSHCLGSKCNSEVFPADRLSCHICDSSTDPKCETKPNSLSICPKYSEHDRCISAYWNGLTQRGCATSVSCDPTNSRGCDICEGAGCNTVNVAKKQDDNYGKWQDLPLTCLACSGAACSGTPTKQTCRNHNEQDCVTVFGSAGEVLQRNCSDEIEKSLGSYCDENPDKCLPCKSNLCNSATSLEDFTECIYCDTNKDPQCLWNPRATHLKKRLCQGGCMTALYPSINSDEVSYQLIRSCLSDKEETDRRSCRQGKDDFCLACDEEECNIDSIPDNRRSCYQCSGEECENPDPSLCPLYKDQDQCFVLFDKNKSILEMGCASSFHQQTLENLLKTKKIWFCSGDNCNHQDSLPKMEKCAVCDSATERACAINANEVDTFQSCDNLPYSHCYSRISSNGTTERGCLADLPPDDFVSCLLNKNDHCGVCLGEACNREVFPENRLQCFTCSAEAGEKDCDSKPAYKEPCPFVTDSETCITYLHNDWTIRGCSSDIFCDSENPFTCRSCNASECNSIDLFNKVYDSNQGLWQELPLRCHTCEGEHCQYSLGPALTCTKNDHQQCMTVFDTDGNIRRRGCEDLVEDYEDLYCREHPQLCFKCKSNQCNDVWDIQVYINCTYCNSADDPTCVLNPEDSHLPTRPCNHRCMVALKDHDIIRSCLDDKEILAQSSCTNDALGANCAQCNGDHCNNFVYPADRLRCHVCSGPSCSKSKPQYCLKYGDNDYCFAKYENGKVDLMGCASNQSSADLEQWEKEKKLYVCQGSDCNDLEKLPESSVCVACDSSKTPNCAQDPSNVTTTEECFSPTGDQCVTTINNEGHTIRGCFSKMPQEEQDSCVGSGTCAVCTGPKCNTAIFPEKRRQCYRCNNANNKECETKPYNLQICPIYKENDSCVAKRDKEGYAVRGCGSELDCSTDLDKICDKCSEDGCNKSDISFGLRTVANLGFTLTLALLAIFISL